MAIEGIPAHNRKNKLHGVTIYAILSFVIGAVIGLLAIQTGFDFIFAGYPSHGPAPIFGGFYLIFGSLTAIGSIMVLARNTRLFGAILILIFGFLGGGGSYFWDVLLLKTLFGYGFIASYFLASLLPIASFILALYARKIDRTRGQD